ncbi:WYL domain-containing protein [Cricetibacter osteomyelitidis]|nr:WYL domain-containing protein [Cricetibacter osteomyelitidis]
MFTQSIEHFLEKNSKKFNQIERLIFIDIYLNYLGVISRLDIMNEFEIAAAAASKDLNEYRELNRSGTLLNNKERVTEISEQFQPIFKISPNDALDVLINGFNRNRFTKKTKAMSIEIINDIQPAQIEEESIINVTRALHRKKGVRCLYTSSNSKKNNERILFPTILFINNQDWYFRAFERDDESAQFKNFKISRVTKATYDPQLEPLKSETIEYDNNWNTFMPIEVKINSKLPEPIQRGIQKDFFMEDSELLTITSRAALFTFIKSNFKIGFTSEIDDDKFLYFELVNQSTIETILSLARICNKNHRYANVLSTLPLSQNSEKGRHRCAGCAYEAGIRDGLNNKKRSLDELDLPYSQAGTGRHRSAQEAYNLGWQKGFADFNIEPHS